MAAPLPVKHHFHTPKSIPPFLFFHFHQTCLGIFSLSLSLYPYPSMDPSAQAVLAASASFFVVTVIFAIIFALCQKPRKQTTQTHGTQPEETPSLTSITITESATFDPTLDRVSMHDLMAATNNFSSDGIIGDGSFGLVYKARLPNGDTVAVKKLNKDAFQGFREFRAEMETLGKKKIRHPNLVRILGYCVQGHDRILIYEFIQNGSLDQWIHDPCSSDDDFPRYPLSWQTRVNIIKGIAKGLLFLHTLDTPIIHRDIKASNVLLDSEFEAHIADFGLARQIESWHSHVSTQVAGTMGYMPPEYRDGMTAATTNADVYSFGILMIEVATARRPNWPMRIDDGNEMGFVEWAQTMVAQNRHTQILDSSITMDNLTHISVVEFMRIACWCTREIPKDRPSMADVVKLLDKL